MRNLTKEERKLFKRALSNTPMIRNGYWHVQAFKKRFKVSRLTVMLHLDKFLERWELVHHKDGDRQNDAIENLEVLNISEHNAMHHNPKYQTKPDNWKPANTTPPEVIKRIKEIASQMIKINCSEISRRLKSEGVKISSMAVKKYI